MYGHLNTKYIEATRHVKHWTDILSPGPCAWLMLIQSSTIQAQGKPQPMVVVRNRPRPQVFPFPGVPPTDLLPVRVLKCIGPRPDLRHCRHAHSLLSNTRVQYPKQGILTMKLTKAVNFVSLMVNEAQEASKGLSPENSILTRMGARMPLPEPSLANLISKEIRYSLQDYCDGS